VGNLLRHDTPFTYAWSWRQDDTRRIASLSEECAHDLGLTVKSLYTEAQDRNKWAEHVTRLHARLQQTPRLVRLWEARWPAARRSCAALADFQYVEEGSEPFPRVGDELHIYTDGSRQLLLCRIISMDRVKLSSCHCPTQRMHPTTVLSCMQRLLGYNTHALHRKVL